MSVSGTKRVGGVISTYLNRNVVAVDLPGMRKVEGVKSEEEVAEEDKAEEAADEEDEKDEGATLPQSSTYPALILDGASGTGKTQQAFALVKKHKTIIYFLISKEPEAGSKPEQDIYRTMRWLTGDEDDRRFSHRVDEAIKALGEDEKNKNKDICSVQFLQAKINRASEETIDLNKKLWARVAPSDDKGLDQLMDVVLWMCSKHLQPKGRSFLRVVPIQKEGKTSCRFQELCSQLQNIILFVDEALPMNEVSADGRPHPGAIDRLRFVRNLGRALTMRVVLAGTAATAANMISAKVTGTSPSSRSGGPGELAWIECQFLCNPMSEDEVKKVVLPNLASPNDVQAPPNDWELALISELARSRPYLVHLFGQVVKGQHINSRNLLEMLEEMGETLAREKDPTDKSNLSYYSGAWLDQRHVSPCPFVVKPAELVRGHYFEPCVVLDENLNPVCGLLMGERALGSGHLRIKIYRYHYEQRTMWCASIQDETPRAGFCWDFAGMEYSLSGCVQQCLAREPLLAVALSTQCRKMDKTRFRKALSMLYQETSQQLTIGSVDGELNEHILFALLQLASNSDTLTGDRVKLGTFLKTIVDYLTNDSDASFALCLKAFCLALKEYGELGLSEFRESAIQDTIDNKFEIVDRAGNGDKYTIPWLVPACSFGDLNDTMARAPSLFDDLGIAGLRIAGLVPGVPNAAFDAEAYPWKTLPKETPPEAKDKVAKDKVAKDKVGKDKVGKDKVGKDNLGKDNLGKDKVALPEWVFEFRARKATYSIEAALDDLRGKCVLRQKENLVSEAETKKGRWASLINRAKKYSLRRARGGGAKDEADQLKCHAILIAVTGGRKTCCEIVLVDIGSEKYVRVALVVGLGLRLLK